MKINIKPSDCKFIVKPEEGIVVCIKEKTQYLLYHFLDNVPPLPVETDFELPSRFVGVAKCHGEDQFDEKIGRAIAFNKMRVKLITSFYKRAQKYIDTCDEYINKTSNSLNGFFNKFCENCNHETQWIEEQLKKE